MEPRLWACPEQFALLIEYMERHGDLAKPQLGPQGRLRSKAMWSELTTLLNSVGGGVVKPIEKWKKVWADWKTKTKKKHLDIKHRASGTGGGPSSRHCLTPFEERVISILGVSAVSGQLKLPELGFNSTWMLPMCQISLKTDKTAAPPAAIESAFDVEEVVIEVPYSPPLQLSASPPLPPPPSSPLPLFTSPISPPLPSPPSPSSLLPPSPSSLLPPPPSSLLPLPPSSRGHKRPSPRQRSVTTFSVSTEPRRNRGLTPFDRTTQMFAEVEQRRLDLEERRLVLEDERERRRLEFDRERDRRQHERDMKIFELMQSLYAISQQPPPPPPPTSPN